MSKHSLVSATVLLLIAYHISKINASDAWGYTPQAGGQSNWPKNFPTCACKRQSPIKLAYWDATCVETLPIITMSRSSKACSKINMLNDGHSVKLELEPDAFFISLNGDPSSKQFSIAQIHWHWGSNERVGSEHTIDGHRYALEQHIVMFNKDLYNNFSEAAGSPNGLAVLGMVFQVDDNVWESNTLFANYGNFLSDLPKVIFSNASTSFILPVEAVLPSGAFLKEYYRYQGSLTTPPCTENVLWTVLARPLPVNWKTLQLLRNLRFGGSDAGNPMVDNYRRTQASNHGSRLILRSASDELGNVNLGRFTDHFHRKLYLITR